MGKLTALKIRSLAEPGRYADSDGLFLDVTGKGTGRWIIRIQSNGRRRGIGLGSLKTVSLSDTRDAAFVMRKKIAQCIDGPPVASCHPSPLTWGWCGQGPNGRLHHCGFWDEAVVPVLISKSRLVTRADIRAFCPSPVFPPYQTDDRPSSVEASLTDEGALRRRLGKIASLNVTPLR